MMQNEQKIEIDDCWNRIGVWRKSGERCPRLDKEIHCHNCSVYIASGRRLLNRPAPQEYLLELTHLLAEEKKTERTDIKSAFVFRAGGEWLALDAELVQEVVDMSVIHTLPHISDHILRGLVNIRGKLEICVSIGGVLGIERLERPDAATTYVAPERLVVVKQEGKLITFPVSEVMGITRYHPEMTKELPITVSGSKAVYTRGILCINDLDIGLLKDKLLFKTLTKDLK